MSCYVNVKILVNVNVKVLETFRFKDKDDYEYEIRKIRKYRLPGKLQFSIFHQKS